MLLDLLCSTNQISFNIKVAEVLGLHTAIYLSEISNICEKAIRKNKIEELDGLKYFTITSRDYITSRTTLKKEEQKELDEKLIKLGVLVKHPTIKDSVFLNMDGLAGLLDLKPDDSIIVNASKIAKTANKKTKEEKDQAKREAMKNKAQQAVSTTIPELRTAWYNWIDAALDRYNTISRAAVINNEKMVNEFANGNINAALEVVNWTATKGYNTMEYAINNYRTLHPSNRPVVVNNNYKMGNEVF